MITLGIRSISRHLSGVLVLPLFVAGTLAGCSSGGGGSSDVQPPEQNMMITPPPSAPDLVVTVTVTDLVDSDNSIVILAEVRNTGDEAADSTRLRYFRSENATITTDDTVVGDGTISGLGAGGGDFESTLVSAPIAGTYYYGACVDSVAGETNTSNNCSSGVSVTVSSSTAPDLEVTVSVDDSTVNAGASIRISATVRNRGDEAADSTRLRYFRSGNETISTQDTPVGDDAVSSLSAGASGSESITVSAPSSAGTYYYGACVDSVAGESSTNNNCSSGERVTVSSSTAPDLEVTVSVDDSTVNAGASIRISATVRNRGDEAADSTRLRYFRSGNETISTQDTPVGDDAVSSLSAGASGSESITVSAPSSAGTYYYGACVDSVAGETDTSNNCSSGVRVTVSSGSSGSGAWVENQYAAACVEAEIRDGNYNVTNNCSLDVVFSEVCRDELPLRQQSGPSAPPGSYSGPRVSVWSLPVGRTGEIPGATQCVGRGEEPVGIACYAPVRPYFLNSRADRYGCWDPNG